MKEKVLVLVWLAFIFALSTHAYAQSGDAVDSGCDDNCSEQNPSSALATNLAPFADYSTEYIFVDAFKTARPWSGLNNNGSPTLLSEEHEAFDENFWLTEIPAGYDAAATYIFTDNPFYPAGTYLLLYKGEGTVDYRRDPIKVGERDSAGYHIDILQVDNPATGIEIRLTETDPNNTGDYIRDMHLIMPGYDEFTFADQMFHPDFLASLTQYRGVRLMDWGNINFATVQLRDILSAESLTYEEQRNLRQISGSYVRDDDPFEEERWEDRALITDAYYTTNKGVPYEVMFALIDETELDIWVNIPHTATNNYVWNMAQLFAQQLNPNVTLYLEYTNEAWNTIFGQSQWIDEQARQMWGDPTSADIENYRNNFYGYQSWQTCNNWRSSWQGAQEQIVCVFSMQAGTGFPETFADQVLACPLVGGEPCGQSADAIAIAPYFGHLMKNDIYLSQLHTWAALAGTEGMDNVIDQILYGGQLLDTAGNPVGSELEDAFDNMFAYKTIAINHNLPLVAYEAGQHLDHHDDTIAQLFIDTNRYPRMAEVYEAYWEGWRDIGGSEAFHYYNTGNANIEHGSWGAQWYFGDDSAPKADALAEFIAENPCWWPNCGATPVTDPARLSFSSLDGYGTGDFAIPISYVSNDNAISQIVMQLQYEPLQVTFDTVTAIESHLSAQFEISATVDANTLTITIDTVPDEIETLDDGELFTLHISISTIASGQGIWFVGASEAEQESEVASTCYNIHEQELGCVASGILFSEPPTNVTFATIQVTPSTPIWLGLVLLLTLITYIVVKPATKVQLL